MLHRRNFIITSLATLGLAIPSYGQQISIPENTKLIILRHADRAGEELTERGIERSEALVEALKEFQIDHIYSPSIKRNLDTAAPLAADRNLGVEAIQAGAPTERLMREGGGKTIVWIGNKGNLRTIWEDLGAADPPPLEYGDLYIVTPGPTVERRRFGP